MFTNGIFKLFIIANVEDFTTNCEKTIISREIIVDDSHRDDIVKNISREIKLNNNLEQLKSIRINNVFVGANKKFKTKFLNDWNTFVNKIMDLNNYALLGYISSVSVEVVSDKYVLFSTKLTSDSVVFNNNIQVIEDEFFKNMNLIYKFIALDLNEWAKEKDKFIKNKNIERKIISEEELKIEDEIDSSIDEAQDIFGDIVEIK